MRPSKSVRSAYSIQEITLSPKQDDATADATDNNQPQDSTQSVDSPEDQVIAKKRFIRGVRRIRTFFGDHGEVMIRDGIVGLGVGIFVSLVALFITLSFQNEFEDQAILENTRFARQLSLMDGPKPLSGLNLRGAELPTLNLSRANLARADLTEANLAEADLTDAGLIGADLTNARLTEADLSGAKLFGAALTNADLTWADLTGADLTDVHITRLYEGETISGLCYDSSTVWPEGYEVGFAPTC